MTLEVTDAAKDVLMTKGFDQIYGARPMRRAIMVAIEDPLAEGLLHGSFQPGDQVTADARDGEIVLEIATPAPLIPEESGLSRVLRDTFSRSVAGVLWSVEKLFVGIALAGPWIVLAILVLVIWKRVRRPKAA